MRSISSSYTSGSTYTRRWTRSASTMRARSRSTAAPSRRDESRVVLIVGFLLGVSLERLGLKFLDQLQCGIPRTARSLGVVVRIAGHHVAVLSAGMDGESTAGRIRHRLHRRELLRRREK